MLCLALDTSTTQGRFALAEDGAVLIYQPHNISGRVTDALLPVMDAMMGEAGRTLAEVDLVAATRGPGSFTGVRVGVATAKAVAYAAGASLASVSSLEAMAAAMLREHPERTWAVPALDARRGEIFAGVFKRADHWVEATVTPSAAGYDDWWARVKKASPDIEAPVYAGSGAALLLGEGESLRDELRALGEPVLRPWSSGHPATAEALAAVASAGELDDRRIDPFALTPLYLRASDAEVQRGLDLTPKGAEEGLALLEDRRPETGTSS